MDIKKSKFCKKGFKTAYSYCMTNGSMSVSVCEIGADILSINVPDRNGDIDDVVLGFDNHKYYFYNWMTLGSVIGRYANRIDTASFKLNGETYKLQENMKNCCIHSGKNGYQVRIWKSDSFIDSNGAHVVFKLNSPDGDQGFPGNLDVSVEYTLSESNILSLTYSCTTDKDTPVNLTNHCYFNLAGHGSGSVLSHNVTIYSDEVTQVDDRLMPTGKIMNVKDTAFDFTTRKKISDNLDKNFEPICQIHEYDINYVLHNKKGDVSIAAELEEDNSGRGMRVYTDMPGMQFYTGNAVNEEKIGKGKCDYLNYPGVCFETQFFPNAINIPEFIQPVVKGGETFTSNTKFEFYTFS